MSKLCEYERKGETDPMVMTVVALIVRELLLPITHRVSGINR